MENERYEFAMESTGKYWISVFNILEDKIKVYLAHPKYIKSIKGKKTDKKDSKWIADLFKCDLVKNSFIPPKDIRGESIIAIARKMLVSIYHMIITGEVYNPVDYDTYNKPKSETSKNKNNNIIVEEALELLKSKGYITDSLQITSTNA